MTGTSIDGIDISLVKTNGIYLKRNNKNYFYAYPTEIKKILLETINQDINFNIKRKKLLDEMITLEHFKALKSIGIINKSNLIGFHGQTIYHNPDIKRTIQLGDPFKLSKLCKKDVVFDFRTKDIKSGGQGAPLAPIYHKLIIEELGLKLPSCVLNIGGVANLSYWDGKQLIGFDTGPGNALMDNFMQKISNNFFDENGFLASQGKPNQQIVDNFLKHSFFKKHYPKSLDRNSFIDNYNQLLNENFSISNTMATIAAFTIESIVEGLKLLPQKVKNILITGGGYRNSYLIKILKRRLDISFLDENDVNLNFDYIESELIAYIAARSINNLPITFPSTTGVLEPLSGGRLFKYL